MKEIEVEFPLEIDQQAFTERSGAENLILDEKIKILMRENRIGISIQSLKKIEFPTENKTRADLKIICLAHAHPECEYDWVTATVNFSKYQGIVIKDLSPREVVGNPVKMTTTYTSGANFEVDASLVKAGLKYDKELAAEKDVYFPSITSSGIGFAYAQWEFRAGGERASLHVDQDLRILLEYPFLTKFVSVKFIVRAEVAVRGMLSYIPLVGTREVEFEVSANF